MIATVTYEGVAIAKGAPAREDGPAGVFVDCEFPMPVGTQLEIQLDHGGPRPARVVRVIEAQQGTGMAVEWAGEARPTPPPANVPAAPAAAPEPTPPSGGKKKKRR